MLNLLLIRESDNNYVLIKDFNRFMHNQTKSHHTKHFRMHLSPVFHNRCNTQQKQRKLYRYRRRTGNEDAQKGGTLKRQNFHKKLQAPFVIYADCEAITEKVSGCIPNNNRPFAGSGHMVRNKLHWDANEAVGLSKQRNSYQSSVTFLCFESPTASFASQCNLFRTM